MYCIPINIVCIFFCIHPVFQTHPPSRQRSFGLNTLCWTYMYICMYIMPTLYNFFLLKKIVPTHLTNLQKKVNLVLFKYLVTLNLFIWVMISYSAKGRCYDYRGWGFDTRRRNHSAHGRCSDPKRRNNECSTHKCTEIYPPKANQRLQASKLVSIRLGRCVLSPPSLRSRSFATSFPFCT